MFMGAINTGRFGKKAQDTPQNHFHISLMPFIKYLCLGSSYNCIVWFFFFLFSSCQKKTTSSLHSGLLEVAIRWEVWAYYQTSEFTPWRLRKNVPNKDCSSVRVKSAHLGTSIMGSIFHRTKNKANQKKNSPRCLSWCTDQDMNQTYFVSSTNA